MAPRWKYLLGGGIAACGLVSGLVLLGVNTAATLTTSPDLRDGFTGEQVVTVELDPADPPAIYVADSGSRAPGDCVVRSAAGELLTLGPPPRRYRETVGGRSWAMLHVIEVPEAGEYQVSCTGQTTIYAIGDAARANQGFAFLMTTIVAIGLISVGAGVGGGIILFTYLRRNRTRSAA